MVASQPLHRSWHMGGAQKCCGWMGRWRKALCGVHKSVEPWGEGGSWAQACPHFTASRSQVSRQKRVLGQGPCLTDSQR